MVNKPLALFILGALAKRASLPLVACDKAMQLTEHVCTDLQRRLAAMPWQGNGGLCRRSLKRTGELPTRTQHHLHIAANKQA
jgi:hypothetical protein